MIYVECKPDTILVRSLGVVPPTAVVHDLRGKGGVIGRLSGLNSARALVDEDPAGTQPRYLRRFTVEQEEALVGLRLLHDPEKGNYVTVLCPRLEEWIERAAEEAGLEMRSYGLPNDAIALHRVINVDLSKFERLVADLRDSERFKRLRELLVRC